ncbi:pectinesterase inhibitor 8 [Brachypodium distachyon]|uniref:Pectinesterase inhibitor domain-containing protein n=1 Tax=Brachypodium distachyon TaxID=15368 RepID=A0A2K2DC25_BRADI|nr:pectinesterase inhibitor 8 [Brachypodium distachyon]PNT71819.1 hypothetical protein BRADI_2g35918v3 [Brachypodium distachyon]|eukprot:XP_010233335.1 pectinesterase inhibitor 8 [Brachypodium distachyon]
MIKAASAAALLAILASMSAGSYTASAPTIERTCKAAAALDARVDAEFCEIHLVSYHGAADVPDPWGLAKTSALIGVTLTDDVLYDLKDPVGKKSSRLLPPPRDATKDPAAAASCAGAYDKAGAAFADAFDDLAARRYPAAKEKMARVPGLLKGCDDALAGVGIKPTRALKRYAADCQQMAFILAAITGLIK